MTPQIIVDRARGKTGCTVGEVSDALVFADLNDLYFQLWEEMIQIDQNLGLTSWTENLVQGVSKYVFKQPNPTAPLQKDRRGMYKPNAVLTGRDGYKKQHFLIDFNQIKTDPKRLADGGREIYNIEDDGVTIYPTPKENIPQGITIYAHNKPYDLTNLMAESEIIIPKEYRQLLVMGLIPKLYEYRQDYNLMQVAEAEFLRKKSELYKNMKQRATRPMQSLPSDRSFI